jgi:outer membrane receptor protein involved in Fe transport
MMLSSRVLLLALALPPIALGAEPGTEPVVPEIVVTGEFREPELSSVPASISVLTEQDIVARNAHHLEELLGMAANVNYASGASRGRYFQIRGIGERGQFAEPLNSSVGLLIDHVDFSGVGAVGTLYDVSQVEIFRGPQGTRYGANALAGLINVTTNQPTAEQQGSLRAELANYDSYSLAGTLSGPLSDRVGYRVAVQQLVSDGFIDNDFLDADDTNDRDELTLRGKLSWLVGDASELDLMLGYIDIDNGYDAFSLDNNRDTRSDEPGHDRQESSFGSIQWRWSGAERFNVEAVATYADSDIEYGYDEDWTFVGFHPFGYSSTDNYLRDRQTATAEVRVLSEPDGRLFKASTDWVVGAYYLDQQVDLTRQYTFQASDFDSRFEIDRYAVFGQTESALGNTTTLTLGARLERHESTYDDNLGVHFEPDDDLWGARIALDHMLNTDTLVYGSISRGYKAGGFNTDGTLDADLREFDPEVLYNYELGIKGSWLEDTVVARVSLFYMSRDDMQVASSETRVRPDGSAEFISYVGNASEGNNWGLEAELDWQVADPLRLFASVGLLNTEYEDYINGNGDNLDGRDQAHAPKYQFFASAQYDFNGGWFARIEVEGKDEFYFSDSHGEQSDAYELLNASIGFERGAWSARVWGRNLTDEDYRTRGFFFGNDPRLDYEGKGYNQLGEPRRVGLTVDWAF